MEEIEVLMGKALDEYLEGKKYAQTEDLLAACATNISDSLAGMQYEIFEVRGTGRAPDLGKIAGDIQDLIQNVAVMAHCLDLYIPEFEEIEEFIEEEFNQDHKMDATMCLLSIHHIFSKMILEYYVAASDPEDQQDLLADEMMQVGIIDMLASLMSICNRYKLDFTRVVVYGA